MWVFRQQSEEQSTTTTHLREDCLEIITELRRTKEVVVSGGAQYPQSIPQTQQQPQNGKTVISKLVDTGAASNVAFFFKLFEETALSKHGGNLHVSDGGGEGFDCADTARRMFRRAFTSRPRWCLFSVSRIHTNHLTDTHNQEYLADLHSPNLQTWFGSVWFGFCMD